jgi:predicted transposase/invertase (TIGR01784 family)
MAKRQPHLFLSAKPYIVSFLSDYGFKVTFGDKNNTLFARKAIELIIDDSQPILSLHYLRNEFQGISADARAGIYDVICRDEFLRVFIIEMQVDNYENLLERLQFYAFQIFSSLANKGKDGFKNMAPVHCICIIKGSITDSTKYHQVITLKNEENEIVMDNIVFHLIELGKFPIGKKELVKITTEKEELLYTMKYAHKFDPTKDTLPPFWHKDFFKVALERLDTSKMSAMDVALYQNALMRVRTVALHREEEMKQATEKAAEKAAEKAKTEAIEKLLLRGKATLEEIAEDINVPLEFVKTVEKNLKAEQKRKAKTQNAKTDLSDK